MNYKIFSDGAAKGNPGPAGAGYIVYDENNNIIHSMSINLGISTNNIAEYMGILEAAKYIKGLNPQYVDFFLDSELIVKQLSGQYKVKAEHLLPLYIELTEILSQINHTCRHVPREQNKEADRLANMGVEKIPLA